MKQTCLLVKSRVNPGGYLSSLWAFTARGAHIPWRTARLKCAKTLVKGLFFGGGCKRLNVRFTLNLLSWSCDTSFMFPQLCHVSLRWCNHSPLLLSLSAMATYPPTCSNTNTSQGMNMANSIANLRLKAKEYSLNQVPTVNWEEGERLGGRRGRGGDPLCRRTPADGTLSLGWEPPQHTHGASIALTPICKNVGQRVMQDFSPQAAFFFCFIIFIFYFLLSVTELLFVQKKRHLCWML